MPERPSAPSDRIGIGIHAGLILALGVILGTTIVRVGPGQGLAAGSPETATLFIAPQAPRTAPRTATEADR